MLPRRHDHRIEHRRAHALKVVVRLQRGPRVGLLDLPAPRADEERQSAAGFERAADGGGFQRVEAVADEDGDAPGFDGGRLGGVVKLFSLGVNF